MNELNLRGRLLTTLFGRGQVNENIDVFGLAESCSCSLADARAGLAQLARAGLVEARGRRLTDAGGLRLTMAGLACAAALARYQAVPAERERRSSLPVARACRAA